jgi:arabinose-5-phosphate isomerase
MDASDGPARWAALGSPAERIAYARSVIAVEREALDAVAGRVDDSFNRAVTAIATRKGSTFTTGVGKAGLIAQKVAATMSSTGTPTHFLHPVEALHGDLGRVRADDVVLAFSHSGESAELIRIIAPLDSIGVELIAVTGRANGALARAAKTTVCYGPIEEACPIRMAPSSSCVAMCAIGDALAFTLMKMIGFGGEQFSRFHPSGSLGRKLSSIESVMRAGLELRIAPSRSSVADVFARSRRPGRRTGAVVLIDDDGRLVGLFTDSDLARLFERRDMSLFDRPIAEYMTESPITLRVGATVQDALALLERHKFSEIPVIDEAGRPVGMVDITDFADLLPAAA